MCGISSNESRFLLKGHSWAGGENESANEGEKERVSERERERPNGLCECLSLSLLFLFFFSPWLFNWVLKVFFYLLF